MALIQAKKMQKERLIPICHMNWGAENTRLRVDMQKLLLHLPISLHHLSDCTWKNGELTAEFRQPSLRSQFATLKTGRGQHRKYLPYAFTEHGAIMAASVLNSPKAVEMSIFVVRAFVRLRELLSTHHQLAAKLDELEKKLSTHDKQIVVIFEAIRQLMEEPVPEKRRIGFGVKDD